MDALERELRLLARRQLSVDRSLRHVLWIGGPPRSGKTTIATRIARRHGLRWYNADTQTWTHRDRALRDGHPAARRWEAMTPDERWTAATPAEMFEMSLHRERGPMVVDDLRRLPTSPLIVAEGSPISPEVVASRIAEHDRALWLLPTPELRRARLDAHGPRTVVRENKGGMYDLIAAAIERQAREHGVRVLSVDGSRGVEETLAAVEETFAEALTDGPRAASLAERRALLREANAALAAQVRGYYARPWAQGDAESVVRSFLCECGGADCDASVEVAVGTLSAEPLLAPGHGHAQGFPPSASRGKGPRPAPTGASGR